MKDIDMAIDELDLLESEEPVEVLEEEVEDELAPLSDEELVSILNGQKDNAEGEWSHKLEQQRANAMDYYLGMPYGNEEDGSSDVVTREVMDTIEWIKPELIKMFASGSETVRFEPHGPEDVQAANQATAYVNYLFNRKNPGFSILYQWLNDGLLQKNGIVKVYWRDSDASAREEYEGLTSMELNLLLADEDVELIEQEERQEGAEEVVYDVAIRRMGVQSGVVVENVPPEEFLIARGAKSIASTPYCAHKTVKTVSELREMGYEFDGVEDFGTTDDGTHDQELYIARHRYDDTGKTTGLGADYNPADESMTEVWVYEHYIRMDYDLDGIAELRKITQVGNKILDNEECDCPPFAGWTPIIISHKFHGLSMADLVMDLQRIQSQLFRNMLDNQYLTNNGRYEVIDGMVNLDDLMTSSAHGIVRSKMQGAVKRLDTPQLGTTAFQFIDYVDQIREKRTGVSERTQGLDENSLSPNTAATAVNQVMTAAQQRVELIARVFGETGLTDMFRLIYKEVIQNQTSKDIFRLNDQYIEIDPSEWRERKDLSVVVGLGNGSKDQEMMQLNVIFQNQQQLLANPTTAPLVSEANIYAALEDQVKIFNKASAGRYFTDPNSPQAMKEKAQRDGMQKQMAQMQQQMEQMQQMIDKQNADAKTLQAQSDAQRKADQTRLDAQKLQQEDDHHQDQIVLETAELAHEIELEEKQGRGVALGDN